MRGRPWPAAVCVALVVLVGCQSPEDAAPPPGATGPSSADESSGEASSPGTSTPTATAAPSAPPSAGPTGQSRLRWRAVPGPESQLAVVSSTATLRQTGERTARLQGAQTATFEVPDRFRVSHLLLDDRYAVVVGEDTLAERPDVATVVDLATGDRSVIDGRTPVSTTTGGTWSLGEGALVHATRRGRDYCLAVVDLAASPEDGSRTGPCVPPGHGLADARPTTQGMTVLTFDDRRPSCRTAAVVDGGRLNPLAGPERCTAWDSLLLDGGQIWSVVANERRVEEAVFAASHEGRIQRLGPGTSGSLVGCAGAAYFVRDPQRQRDPARLLRWTPTEGLRAVYASPARGRVFLSEPRCGGDALTISVFSAGGDQQLTAPLG